MRVDVHIYAHVCHVSIGKDTANNSPKLPAVPVLGAIYILKGEQSLALTIVVVNGGCPCPLAGTRITTRIRLRHDAT